MTAPRLRVDLDKVTHNTRVLVDRLRARGIDVLGVTKSVLAAPEVAEAMVRGGVAGLADSRIQNLATLRAAGIAADLTLIRTPMLSECDGVVELAGTSFNTEVVVLDALAAAAGRRGITHGVVLMVELGDLREGIGVDGLHDLVRATLRHPSLRLRGLGTNLACRSGVVPDRRNMGDLSRLANSVESAFGIQLGVVSGGNSATLEWALSGADTGRVTNLRLGEAVLLGREPSHRRPIEGLHTDAVTLVAEVIECQAKPSRPWGDVGQGAFGAVPVMVGPEMVEQALLAVGRQDVDPDGLTAPDGVRILAASSDHLVLDAGRSGCAVGDELSFGVDYSALVRAMTSPFVAKDFRRAGPPRQ